MNTDKDTESHQSGPAVGGPGCNDQLGPLPEPVYAAVREGDLETACWLEDTYTAEQMEAERQRCYALGVAAERERWRAAVAPVLTATEGELPHAIYVLAGFVRA